MRLTQTSKNNLREKEFKIGREVKQNLEQKQKRFLMKNNKEQEQRII
jgi:hypothetical protein